MRLMQKVINSAVLWGGGCEKIEHVQFQGVGGWTPLPLKISFIKPFFLYFHPCLSTGYKVYSFICIVCIVYYIISIVSINSSLYSLSFLLFQYSLKCRDAQCTPFPKNASARFLLKPFYQKHYEVDAESNKLRRPLGGRQKIEHVQ